MRTILAALGCAVLTGCAALNAPERGGPAKVDKPAPVASVPAKLPERPDEGAQLASLLAGSRNFGSMKAEEQKQELNDANQSFNRDRSPYARLRLALLLSVPGTGVDDDARAATLLEPMTGTAAGAQPAGPLQEMAVFLSNQLAERTRERKRTAQFKDQLDALRAVEKSLIERSQGKAR